MNAPISRTSSLSSMARMAGISSSPAKPDSHSSKSAAQDRPNVPSYNRERLAQRLTRYVKNAEQTLTILREVQKQVVTIGASAERAPPEVHQVVTQLSSVAVSTFLRLKAAWSNDIRKTATKGNGAKDASAPDVESDAVSSNYAWSVSSDEHKSSIAQHVPYGNVPNKVSDWRDNVSLAERVTDGPNSDTSSVSSDEHEPSIAQHVPYGNVPNRVSDWRDNVSLAEQVTDGPNSDTSSVSSDDATHYGNGEEVDPSAKNEGTRESGTIKLGESLKKKFIETLEKHYEISKTRLLISSEFWKDILGLLNH